MRRADAEPTSSKGRLDLFCELLYKEEKRAAGFLWIRAVSARPDRSRA